MSDILEDTSHLVIFSLQPFRFPRKETVKTEKIIAKDENSLENCSNVDTETPCQSSNLCSQRLPAVPGDETDPFVVRVKRSNTIPLSERSGIRL